MMMEKSLVAVLQVPHNRVVITTLFFGVTWRSIRTRVDARRFRSDNINSLGHQCAGRFNNGLEAGGFQRKKF
jgi:hypothetical protein